MASADSAVFQVFSFLLYHTEHNQTTCAWIVLTYIQKLVVSVYHYHKSKEMWFGDWDSHCTVHRPSKKFKNDLE